MRCQVPSFGSILCLALACLVLSCETHVRGTHLLTLTGISPKDLELSDELEVQGNGFPEGKPARIAFQGDLYRPGIRVERDVEIVARTTTSSPRSLSLVMNEALREAFTGKGDLARHTTFRGDIEVSFAPSKSGSAPVTGTLNDVVFDVNAPLVTEALQRQRDDESAQALAFLGITLQRPETGECCVIGNVEGRARASGLKSGDLLVDLDGVTVQQPFDLVPSGRSRVARLTFRESGNGPLITRELDVQGYKTAAPSELAPAIGIVGLFGCALLLARTRLGSLARWFAHWLAVRLRQAQAVTLPALRSRAHRSQHLNQRLLGLPSEPGWGLLSVMILIALTVLGTLLALRVDVVSSELDLALWTIAQVVSVVWAAMLSRIAVAANSPWAALRACVFAVMHQIPMLALTATVITTARSLRVADIVAAQADAPLACNFWKSPPMMLLTLLALAALVPEVASDRDRDRKTFAGWQRFVDGLARLLAGTAHLWSAALFIALLAFGGYRVPFAHSVAEPSIGWQLLGVAIWLAKALALVVIVTGWRAIAGTLSMQQAFPTLLRYGLGLAAVGVATARLWSYVMVRYALGWLEEVTGWTLAATTLVVMAWIGWEALRTARSARHELLPNPWI
jgi:NADH:ubiquinone oxidoreductase subunit H